MRGVPNAEHALRSSDNDRCMPRMTPTTRFSYLAIALPYAAVLLGLYVLRNAWATILLYHVGMVTLLRFGGQEGLLRAVRQGWSAPAAAVIGIVFAASGLLLALLWGTISREHMNLRETLTSFHLSGLSWWVFAVYYVTVHPVLEEICWRGYLPRAHRSPVVVDVAFAGYHVLVLCIFIKLPWVLVSFGVLLFAAWSWRQLVARYSGLGVAIASHAAADLSVIAVAEYLIRNQSV
jgi:membrane protease YdiL (CAAX protease family)